MLFSFARADCRGAFSLGWGAAAPGRFLGGYYDSIVSLRSGTTRKCVLEKTVLPLCLPFGATCALNRKVDAGI